MHTHFLTGVVVGALLVLAYYKWCEAKGMGKR